MAIAEYSYFKTKTKLSWMSSNPHNIYSFNYTLTQYTPSVFAKILIAIKKDDYEDFCSVKKLPIEKRYLEIWVENELYNEQAQKSLFSGPWKFVMLDFRCVQIYASEIATDLDDFAETVIVEASCVDRVFYKMTLEHKSRSFGKIKISDLVTQLVTENGGTVKTLVETDYSYRWLQSKMTDYEMIRSLIPFSRSSDNDLVYHFFMYNEKAYFAPIGSDSLIKNKYLLKFEPMTPTSHAELSDFIVEKINGVGSRTMRLPHDDQTLLEIFGQNLQKEQMF